MFSLCVYIFFAMALYVLFYFNSGGATGWAFMKGNASVDHLSIANKA